MNEVVSKSEQIRVLQEQILAMQGFRVPLENELQDTGLGLINTAFPHHTFPTGIIHEFISTAAEEGAATAGFMAGLLGTLMRKGCCLWVSTRRRVFPPALRLFGLAPDQVIFVDAVSNRDALWAIEEGLKCSTLAAVVGEVKDLSFTESRRLQLAVEQSHVTGFIHRNIAINPGTVASVARWRIKPLASFAPDGMPGVGFPQWQVELVKIRNGRPGVWQVQWSNSGFRITGRQKARVALPMQKAG